MDKTSVFECPCCGSKFTRDKHYYALIEGQSIINMLFGNPKPKDMCFKCNYFEYEPNQKE